VSSGTRWGIVLPVKRGQSAKSRLLTPLRRRLALAIALDTIAVAIDVAGAEHELPAKVTLALEAGERLRIETPGGGGYGVERAATGDGTPVATTAFVARGAPSPRAKRVRSRS